MRKIMGNKPQVSSARIIHSPLQISWNDLLYQGQTADVSIIRAKTGTFSLEILDVHLASWWEAWFGLIRSSRHARGQPLSYLVREVGWYLSIPMFFAVVVLSWNKNLLAYVAVYRKAVFPRPGRPRLCLKFSRTISWFRPISYDRRPSFSSRLF
jgi:hypothetical protein